MVQGDLGGKKFLRIRPQRMDYLPCRTSSVLLCCSYIDDMNMYNDLKKLTLLEFIF